MLIPAFTLELKNPILRNLLAVGKYDGKNPSLTCGTSAGKIFFHSPHEKDPQAQVRFLNINRKISALACGKLEAKTAREVLLVGAQTTLLCYDVEQNADLFFKDAPDGVNTIVVGSMDKAFGGGGNMALVGGNCSIQGFDHQGEEVFWTVTGDNVSTMTFCDFEEDGDLELLVGSDDYEIRIFKGEEVVSETTETDRIVALCKLRKGTFGYALANGTVGVYTGPGQRRWRVKSKHEVTSILGFDLDGDGEPELISGWSNGKFEVRSDTTGEVIFKDVLKNGATVAGILSADYRSDGRTEVIVCSTEGEVRAYLPAAEELDAMGGTAIADKLEDETLQELNQRKQEMIFELKQYAEQATRASKGDKATGLVDKDTRVTARLEHSTDDKCLYLALEASHDALIKCAVVFADRLFEGGESVAVHVKTPEASLRVPLRPPRDIAAELQVRAIVGNRAAQTYHVFELKHELTKFSMFTPVESASITAPAAGVTCVLPGAGKKVRQWVSTTFHMGGKEPEGFKDGKSLDQAFVSLRDGKPLCIRLTSDNDGTMHILTEDMELAGEVLQDVCNALRVVELESIAEFPEEMESFRSVLLHVDEYEGAIRLEVTALGTTYNAARLKLTAEMADQSNTAKTLVIKAEDARILGEYKLMRATYTELYTLNAELMGEYTKRANNHEQLLGALKEVNHMIQKAARLRVGGAKARIVSSCREAIKTNDFHALFKIMKSGTP